MGRAPGAVAGVFARRSTGWVICAAVLALAAIHALTRHDLTFAGAMFVVAATLAERGGRYWRRENAVSQRLDSAGAGA